MDIERRTELYKEQYFFELERREKILSRLPLPLAGIIAVGGLLAFMLNDSVPIASTWRIVFWAFFGTSAAALLVSTILVQTVAWSFRKTCYVAEPEIMEDYLRKLQAAYPNGTAAHQQLISKTFDEYVLNTFSRAATYNSRQNDPLSRRQLYAGIALMLGVFSGLFATVPFYVGRLQTGEPKDDRTESTRTAAAPSAPAARGEVHSGGTEAPAP